MKLRIRLCFLLLLMVSQYSTASSSVERQSINLVTDVCVQLQKSPFYTAPLINVVTPKQTPIVFRGNEVGDRYQYDFGDAPTIRLDVIQQSGRPARIVSEIRSVLDQPLFFVGTDGNCKIRQARRLVYRLGRSVSLQILDSDLAVVQTEALNPVPAKVIIAENSNLLPVAMIDAGVNYQLPHISSRMARGSDGQILGFDFWDMDALPFDAHPAGSPFFIQRHGTRTASLLLNEAPEVSLVSYRYPRPSMERFSQLIAHAHGLGVRIVGMPLGSNRLQDWVAFEKAALSHPDMLFIVSAGNNGRDIDQVPVYPAAMDVSNMIVVTSADDFIRPAERTNWGKRSVDFLVPAERNKVTLFNGQQGTASGSSYAVSRTVAMAARLLLQHPGSSVRQLIELISAFAIADNSAEFVRIGYLPDPLVGSQPVSFSRLPALENTSTDTNNSKSVDLDVIVLDQRWQLDEVSQAVDQASEILSQCGLDIALPVFYALNGAEYLRYLDTGASHTLLNNFASQTGSNGIQLVLAKDTKMQVQFDAEAFGRGNTRTRPWLEESVWVMAGARDIGITIAHELFHVIANDGEHSADAANLMSSETRADNTLLTAEQCQRAMRYFKQ